MAADPALNSPPSAPLIQLTDISKRYNVGLPNEAEVLHGVALTLARGEFVALIGPSGSGKSTLLNIIGLLERPSAGSYRIEGQETTGLEDAALTQRRSTALGFVFQFHHLLPAFTALENVTLPALMREGRVRAEQRIRAEEVLAAMGLAQAMEKRPGQLSGGMQQRVAIARALAFKPPLLLMDEPFGALDEITRERLNDELLKIWARTKTTIIFVTHSISEAVFLSSRIVVMSARPGRITKLINIDLPYPRDIATRENRRFFELATEVREALRAGEASRAGESEKLH